MILEWFSLWINLILVNIQYKLTFYYLTLLISEINVGIFLLLRELCSLIFFYIKIINEVSMIDRFFDANASDDQLLYQRRNFLKLGLVGVLGTIAPLTVTKNVLASSKSNEAWNISFRSTNTGDMFSGVYRVGDKYLPEAFERINYVLRDFRTDEVFPMDPHIIDMLSIIHKKTGVNAPYEILSGYRSPKTNNMIGNRSRGVAKNSFHMYGQALDIRIPSYSIRKVHNIAKSIKAGGVGYYPRSNFVHIDTGNVRSWSS